MPKSSRAAGASPRPVIRGESQVVELPVSVDFLNLTFPSGCDALSILNEVVALVGAEAFKREGGFRGYTSRHDVAASRDGALLAVVAFGGEHQRGTVLVSINGTGMRRIADVGDVRSWAESLGARITRVDVCADDFTSEVVDVQRALQAWRDGAFKLSGRPPSAQLIDDLGSGKGCTLNVGSRDGGKLCRVYEKGRELLGKGEGIDGREEWTRAEVEWHAKDRVIPWDILTDPVRFLAGAFPYFALLSLRHERIRTVKRATEITIERLREWVRSAAGKSINALLQYHGGDLGAVVASVRRTGLPKRLAVWVLPGGSLACATG